jgi:hypothetical protein
MRLLPSFIAEADLARVVLGGHLLSGHVSRVVHDTLVKVVLGTLL